MGGILYVRQGQNTLRISIGGPESDVDKLQKSKALAVKAIERLLK